MSLTALRTLVAIAEHGSFAAAARALHLSQSAISTHMKALEAELETTLFDRTKRPPVLNEAGEDSPLHYLIRLAAYGLILWAILEKNLPQKERRD